MRINCWILCFFFFNCLVVSSQEVYTKHSVVKGETVFKISEQYKINPEVIYKLNPGSEISIKTNSVLLIPNVAVNYLNNNYKTSKIHSVQPKETLYGIAKQYQVSVKDLYKVNQGIENTNLKINQKINIPIQEVTDTQGLVKNEKFDEHEIILIKEKNISEKETSEIAKPTIDIKEERSIISREVLPKETKYGIAKQYGISVKELERQNPEIINSFPIGCKLTINTSKFIEPTVVVSNEENVAKKENENLNINLIEQLISKASENLGIPYRSGGITKDGFDCSGLMYNTFGLFDINLPRSSFDQSQYGVKISMEEAKKGDLIFFKTNGRGKINHVGMIVEILDGEIKFIHSSNHGGVIVSSTEESYYAKNLVQVNRVL